MNKLQIVLLCAGVAAVSTVVSSAVTYSVVNKKLGREFEERLEVEKVSMVEWQQMQKKRLATAKVVYGSSDDKKPDTPEEFVESLKTPINYQAYSEKTKVQPVPEGIDKIPSAGRDNIVEISADEFMEYSGDGYTEITLSWFGDGAVLDTDGDLVPDYPDMIGLAEPPFDSLGEEDVAYLKNEERREIYEITREDMTIDEATAADIHVPDGGRST